LEDFESSTTQPPKKYSKIVEPTESCDRLVNNTHQISPKNNFDTENENNNSTNNLSSTSTSPDNFATSSNSQMSNNNDNNMHAYVNFQNFTVLSISQKRLALNGRDSGSMPGGSW